MLKQDQAAGRTGVWLALLTVALNAWWIKAWGPVATLLTVSAVLAYLWAAIALYNLKDVRKPRLILALLVLAGIAGLGYHRLLSGDSRRVWVPLLAVSVGTGVAAVVRIWSQVRERKAREAWNRRAQRRRTAGQGPGRLNMTSTYPKVNHVD